jgi:hypothetical protein
MANAALAWINLFDSATLSASSAAAAMPVTNLQNEHVAVKWRGTGGTTDNFTATWSANQTADTFAIMGLGSTFLATGTVRLQLTSSGGATGDVYDSTVTAGIVDPKYGYAIHLLTPKTFRSAKWTFSQAGASYIEAGRGLVSVRTEVTFNYAPGAQRSRVSNSRKTKSRGGQTYVDRSTFNPRVEEMTFGWIDETQRWALHEEIDLNNLDHTDVLLIKDTASTNLGRDSIWGLADPSPVIQPFNLATLYSKSYRIEERG